MGGPRRRDDDADGDDGDDDDDGPRPSRRRPARPPSGSPSSASPASSLAKDDPAAIADVAPLHDGSLGGGGGAGAILLLLIFRLAASSSSSRVSIAIVAVRGAHPSPLLSLAGATPVVPQRHAGGGTRGRDLPRPSSSPSSSISSSSSSTSSSARPRWAVVVVVVAPSRSREAADDAADMTGARPPERRSRDFLSLSFFRREGRDFAKLFIISSFVVLASAVRCVDRV
jgi:hypothetical protein